MKMGQRGRNFEMRRAVSPVVERQTMPAHSPVLAAVTAEDATEAGVSVGPRGASGRMRAQELFTKNR